jgi:hypothetical protein
MRVQINTKQIAPDLFQKLNDHAGHDLGRYPCVWLDLTSVSPALSQALLDASKVPGSGVQMEDSKSTSPTAKPTLGEGALRLRYRIAHNGLLSCENNTLALRNWFATHPEAKLNAATVDKVIFAEIEHELLWEPQHPGHQFWLRKFQPLPPKPPVEPKTKPLPRLPNGEKRLPIPSSPADLAKASLTQVQDYRDRLRKI